MLRQTQGTFILNLDLALRGRFIATHCRLSVTPSRHRWCCTSPHPNESLETPQSHRNLCMHSMSSCPNIFWLRRAVNPKSSPRSRRTCLSSILLSMPWIVHVSAFNELKQCLGISSFMGYTTDLGTHLVGTVVRGLQSLCTFC